MKYRIAIASLITAMALATTAQAASGTAQTRGQVSKTGFIKERTNEDNHMGKADKSDDVDADTDADALDNGDGQMFEEENPGADIIVPERNSGNSVVQTPGGKSAETPPDLN